MSLLKTIVPVDVQRVIDALPPKSYVHSVTLCVDRQGVEIVWDNDDIKTGRTYAKEYPLENILDTDPSDAKTIASACSSNAGRTPQEAIDKRRKPVKTPSRT